MTQDLADGRYTLQRKTMVQLALVCALAVLLAIIACCVREENRLNFGVVARGVLLRSAQPTYDDLAEMRKEYGLKTIVNLRSKGTMTSDATCVAETAFAEEHGVNFVNLPIDTPPKQEKIEEFLRIVDDPANRPVLVHCAEGQIRASMMCAAYGMERLGWSNETALAQQVPFKFERSRDNKEVAREFILRYKARKSPGKATKSP